MYTVDYHSNRIAPVKMKTFSVLGFTERKHLQEWLAHEPSALGEELLVIQKEFEFKSDAFQDFPGSRIYNLLGGSVGSYPYLRTRLKFDSRGEDQRGDGRESTHPTLSEAGTLRAFSNGLADL